VAYARNRLLSSRALKNAANTSPRKPDGGSRDGNPRVRSVPRPGARLPVGLGRHRPRPFLQSRKALLPLVRSRESRYGTLSEVSGITETATQLNPFRAPSGDTFSLLEPARRSLPASSRSSDYVLLCQRGGASPLRLYIRARNAAPLVMSGQTLGEPPSSRAASICISHGPLPTLAYQSLIFWQGFDFEIPLSSSSAGQLPPHALIHTPQLKGSQGWFPVSLSLTPSLSR